MSNETDPTTGMTIAMPGSGPGDAAWRAALEEKARMLRSMRPRG